MSRLVVVSNRVGPLSDEGKAGGLAVGLADALRKRGGVWFGWSGETSEEGTFGPLHLTTEGEVQLATVDMTEGEVEEFYSGYANQGLWPVLHYRIDLASFERRFADAYQRVNERMAERLRPQLKPDDLLWIHDYHFFHLGEQVRKSGFEGRIGFFLHVPFPPPEIMMTLPGARQLVRALLSCDVVGFQTEIDRDNFRRFVTSELGGTAGEGGVLEAEGRRLVAGVFPIGIDAERFAEFATSAEAKRRETQVRNLIGSRKQVIGVDRLDYSKGIPERIRGFERLLQDHPENCSRVNLLQIAPLSRAEVDVYAALRRELEELAGHVNGKFAALDWTPVRVLTRGFTRKTLAGLYRASHVCLITSLRDGMNLVAKEYVAAQDPEDPGVLVLSRFTGAARELGEALIVNPHDPADIGDALQMALNMPLAERKARWQALNAKVIAGSAERWCERFLDVLDASSDEPDRTSEPATGMVRETRLRAVRSGGIPLHGDVTTLAAARPK